MKQKTYLRRDAFARDNPLLTYLQDAEGTKNLQRLVAIVVASIISVGVVVGISEHDGGSIPKAHTSSK